MIFKNRTKLTVIARRAFITYEKLRGIVKNSFEAFGGCGGSIDWLDTWGESVPENRRKIERGTPNHFLSRKLFVR
jgi:hypothetical protein